MDGAPYHYGDLTRQVLHSMKTEYLILAAFSTDSAPIERVFAMTKSGQLDIFNNEQQKW